MIATSTFDGIDSSASGSIDNDSCAVASSVGVMDSTEPTVTPAIFTRAPRSITSPARSAITVIGTRATNTWLKDATRQSDDPDDRRSQAQSSQLVAVSVHAVPLTGQIEVAGTAVERE